LSTNHGGEGLLSPLRLSANISTLFTELPFLARFDAAAAAGFAAVELQYPYDYRIGELRRVYADAGLPVVLMNTPAGDHERGERGSACIPGAGGRFRDDLDRALDYALALECSSLHVLSGNIPPSVMFETAWKTYEDSLGLAAEIAKSAGLRILIEPLNAHDAPDYLLGSFERASDIVRKIGPEKVALQFDTYHSAMEGLDVASLLGELLDIIGHVQIADVPGRGEPCSGGLDWSAIFRVLAEGYSGWVGCEYQPQGPTLAGLVWRKTLLGAPVS